MQQFLINDFPLFSEIVPPQVIAYYIYLMELDDIDISGLNFAEIPLAPAGDNYKGPRLRRRRRVTEDIEKETKRLKKEAWKDRKKEEKKKDVALKAYSEPSQKGNSDKTSLDSVSEFIEPLLKPFQSTSSENPIPLSFSASPTTQTYDTPMSEPTSLNNSGSEPNTSEIPMSEPLISELTTQMIPLAHLDNSGNEVLISDAIPVVTLPYENSPSSAIILHQPIPNNLEEYINLFGYDALRQIQDLRTNTCPNPALVKRDWEEFRRWLNQSFQHGFLG